MLLRVACSYGGLFNVEILYELITKRFLLRSYFTSELGCCILVALVIEVVSNIYTCIARANVVQYACVVHATRLL